MSTLLTFGGIDLNSLVWTLCRMFARQYIRVARHVRQAALGDGKFLKGCSDCGTSVDTPVN